MLKLCASNLSRAQRVAHGFFGRQGGISTGVYASLNCGPGSGDERAHVVENRRKVESALGAGTALVSLYQVHGAHAVTVTEAWALGQGPKADGMVCNRPGIALGILTADCTPVLFADAEAGVIGAAHAGWKGALAGITDSVVAAMESLGASRTRIAAAIGPTISQRNYEVGQELREGFCAEDPGHARYFIPAIRDAHWQFDLPAYVHDRIARAGLSNIESLNRCTYAGEAEFFSFRRATHRGEQDYGRQVSAILLNK